MKKIVSLALATALVAATSTASFAAKSIECKVTAIEGNTMTLECKKIGKLGKLKVGQKLKVKKKKKAIEGC